MLALITDTVVVVLVAVVALLLVVLIMAGRTDWAIDCKTCVVLASRAPLLVAFIFFIRFKLFM